MQDARLPVFGGAGANHASHIVAIGRSFGLEHDTSTDPGAFALHDHLVANGVRLSIRRDLLRFSFGIYNIEADVDRVVGLCTDWIETRPAFAA